MDLGEELLGWVETFKEMRPPSKRKQKSVWRVKGVGRKDCTYDNVKRRSGEGLI